MAKRFLGSLGTNTASTSVQRQSSGRSYVGGGQPYRDNWDYERIVQQGYERCILVFRCVDIIAWHAARLPMGLRQGDPVFGDWVRPNDPLLRLLNRAPNKYLTGLQFRWLIIAQLLLNRQGAFIEVITKNGKVVGLFLMPPGRTAPVVSNTTFVESFEVQVNAGITDTVRLAPYTPGGPDGSSILWIRHMHPSDPYSGSSPLQAMGVDIDSNFLARLYNRNFLARDGRPAGIVTISGDVSPDDREEIGRRVNGAQAGGPNIAVVEGEDLKYVDLMTSQRDAQFVNLAEMTEDNILTGFGIPKSILGNASKRTFTNAGQEEQNFWNSTMLLWIGLIDDALDQLTPGGLEDDVWLRHNTDSITILQQPRMDRRKAALAEFLGGAITLQQFAVIAGERADLYDQPGCKVFWVAGGKVPIGIDEESTKAALTLQQVGSIAFTPQDLEAQKEQQQLAGPEPEPDAPGAGGQSTGSPDAFDGGSLDDIDMDQLRQIMSSQGALSS